MLPKHTLYLRAYEGDGFQTILFAVPPERVLTTLHITPKGEL
jgi:hypothetical protein